MKSTIKTIHEEYYGDNNAKSISILLNILVSDDNQVSNETFILYYDKEIYVVFNTIIDAYYYIISGERYNLNRAYISEKDFDKLYNKNLPNKFNDYLTWQSK